MRIWMVGVLALAACTEEMEDPEKPRPCMGSTRWLDAGTHWQTLFVNEPVDAIINAIVEPVDGGSRIVSLDGGEFRVSAGANDPCSEQRIYSGNWAAVPIQLPAGILDAPFTRPGQTSGKNFFVTNLTDSRLFVDLRTDQPEFAPIQLTAKTLPAREAVEAGFVFSPEALGRKAALLTVATDGWSGSFPIGGYGGGPIVEAPQEIDAGIVAYGFSRRDVRTVTVRNAAGATEDPLSDLLFYGDPISTCDTLNISALPPRIPRGESHDFQVTIDSFSFGDSQCTMTLRTQAAPVVFRVRWSTVNMPPCQFAGSVSHDGGVSTVQLTAIDQTCLFTYPRFELADAGWLDIDWREFRLDGGDTLTIPVIATGNGAVVLNSNQNPSGVTRIDVQR
ncbi:MAG: hypothetical protein ACO1OB_32990 [Archangium sp.]